MKKVIEIAHYTRKGQAGEAVLCGLDMFNPTASATLTVRATKLVNEMMHTIEDGGAVVIQTRFDIV